MPKPASRNICPVCAAPTDPVHSPFCSQGCRDRDLLQWLGEGYRIPGPKVDPGLDSPEGRD